MCWHVVLTGGKPYTFSPEESLSLSFASLDTAASSSDDVYPVLIEIEGVEISILLCTLSISLRRVLQATLKFTITKGTNVTIFTEGRCTVHLSGRFKKKICGCNQNKQSFTENKLILEKEIAALKKNNEELKTKLTSIETEITQNKLTVEKKMTLKKANDVLKTKIEELKMRLTFLEPETAQLQDDKLTQKKEIIHPLIENKDVFKTENAELKTRLTSFKLETKQEVIVAVGGKDRNGILNSCEYFCPTTKIWRTLANLPFTICLHDLVTCDKNYLYLAGGELFDKEVSSNSFWRYDPGLNKWQKMASMVIRRIISPGLAALDGYIYSVGGCMKLFDAVYSVERYDPNTNRWRFVQKLKKAVFCATVIAHGKMLYVAGGCNKREGSTSCFQRYDPITDTWTELPPMSQARSGAVSCVLDDFIYVIGGEYEFKSVNLVERFDVQNNRWGRVVSMKKSRYKSGVAVINKKIYVMGGFDNRIGDGLDSVECYDPVKNKWNIISSKLLSPRFALACVPLKVKL